MSSSVFILTIVKVEILKIFLKNHKK